MGIEDLTNEIIDEIINKSIKFGLRVDGSNNALYSEFLKRHYERHQAEYNLGLRSSDHHNSNFVYRDLLCDSLILFSIMRAITPVGTNNGKDVYFNNTNLHLLSYKEMDKLDKGGVGIKAYGRVVQRWRRFQPMPELKDASHNSTIQLPKVSNWKDLIDDVGQNPKIVEQYRRPVTSEMVYR